VLHALKSDYQIIDCQFTRHKTALGSECFMILKVQVSTVAAYEPFRAARSSTNETVFVIVTAQNILRILALNLAFNIAIETVIAD
jgi:hypothetical protein